MHSLISFDQIPFCAESRSASELTLRVMTSPDRPCKMISVANGTQRPWFLGDGNFCESSSTELFSPDPSSQTTAYGRHRILPRLPLRSGFMTPTSFLCSSFEGFQEMTLSPTPEVCCNTQYSTNLSALQLTGEENFQGREAMGMHPWMMRTGQGWQQWK